MFWQLLKTTTLKHTCFGLSVEINVYVKLWYCVTFADDREVRSPYLRPQRRHRSSQGVRNPIRHHPVGLLSYFVNMAPHICPVRNNPERA